MRRLIAILTSLVVVAPPSLAGPGTTITGRIVHQTRTADLKGLEVTLLGARPDGSNRVEETTSAFSNGRFVFRGVPADPDFRYTVETLYRGGLFVGGNVEVEAGQRQPVELRVWDTTSDPSILSVARDHIFVVQNEGDTGILESVTISNSSTKAYIGRGAAIAGSVEQPTQTLGFALPPQALGERVDIVSSDINRLYATEADFGFAATVAIPPGETNTIFGYGVDQSGGTYDISRRALYSTEEFSVFAADPLRVESNRLVYDDEVNVRGDRYKKWSSPVPLQAGDIIPLSVVAEGGSSPGLTVGLALLLGGLVAAIAVALLVRSRRSRRATPRESREPDDVLVAIAELDLQHESGSISEQEWSQRRRALKTKLKEREPTS